MQRLSSISSMLTQLQLTETWWPLSALSRMAFMPWYELLHFCLLSVVHQGTETEALLVQTVEDIDGNQRSLGEFAGKVAVVVNVASSCGFTESNYRGLQFLYEKYKDYDFTVSYLVSIQWSAFYRCHEPCHDIAMICLQLKSSE